MAGDTLTVSEIVMTMTLPEDEGTVSIGIDGMSLTENGDGTVSVRLPREMPIDVTVAAPDGETVDIGLDYTTTGFGMTVSGDPDAMTYNYTAAELNVALGDLVVDGERVDFGTVAIALANVVGTAAMEAGELRRTSQKMSVGPISYSVDIADPEGEGRLVYKGGADAMAFEGKGSFPPELDIENVAAMLDAGFAFEGGFSYEAGNSSFNFQEGDEVVQYSTSSGGGDLFVAMDAGKLRYSGGTSDMRLQMAGSEIPFPIDLALGELAFNLLMPVAEGEEEQDFALGFVMEEFSMSDMIWGMFDPGGDLPHDPATVALDVTGTATLFHDLLDPEKLKAFETGGTVPGALHSMALNRLTLQAAGAELTGKGGFTFDNSDLKTFDGMPAPTGSVDLQLVGGNGLLDKLTGMGLVPEEDASNMRMMLGLFAVPGDGVDTLNSKIEVTGEGQVLANGQRLQ